VFCLVTSPARLLELPRASADAFHIPEEPYASPEHVRLEILNSRRFSRDYGWRQIEITGKSVEEVAREISVPLSTTKAVPRPAW
jgi:regulator of PEP synthase PpsR (kinase-PPPase family)